MAMIETSEHDFVNLCYSEGAIDWTEQTIFSQCEMSRGRAFASSKSRSWWRAEIAKTVAGLDLLMETKGKQIRSGCRFFQHFEDLSPHASKAGISFFLDPKAMRNFENWECWSEIKPEDVVRDGFSGTQLWQIQNISLICKYGMYKYIYIHIHLHTYVYTYIHTHIHTHVYFYVIYTCMILNQ